MIAARKRVAPPTAQTVTVPAPMGGLNTVSSGAAMPPGDCVLLYNLVAAENGLRSRLGSREWCTGLTGASDNQVRSILPFTGSTKSGNRNKLFATTSTGIWDVTASDTTPALLLSFASSAGDAGYGVAHVVVTSAGHFLLYCDEVNGLHIYTESTTTWAAVALGAGATQIAGVTPSTLCFVTVFKNRVWFAEKDSARGWYLAAGAIYGTATQFEFGTKFRAGGGLVGLYNWTIDGGSGSDDSLVAVSGGGDIAVSQGSDPATASPFGLRGVWFAGGVPEGRKIATNFGGDMLLLTRTGVVPMSKLVVGATLETSQYPTAKIANLLNAAMLSKASLKGWSLTLHPEDNSLLITVPTADGSATTQLAMALANKSWSRYRDLPIYSCEAWGGKLYYGTVDGKVGINDGYIDGVTLADPTAYTAVQWSGLTAFTNLGNGRQKQIGMIRPTFQSEGGEPPFSVQARYRYDLTELATVSDGLIGADEWDGALWDDGVWGGEYASTQAVRGATGMGAEMAIAFRGSSTARTVLVSFDVSFEQGGFL